MDQKGYYFKLVKTPYCVSARPLSCNSDFDGPYFFQLWSSVLEKNSVRIYIWISRQLARLNLNIIVKIYKAQQMLHKNLS